MYAKAKRLALQWYADAADGSREKEAAAWLVQASDALFLRTNDPDRRQYIHQQTFAGGPRHGSRSIFDQCPARKHLFYGTRSLAGPFASRLSGFSNAVGSRLAFRSA